MEIGERAGPEAVLCRANVHTHTYGPLSLGMRVGGGATHTTGTEGVWVTQHRASLLLGRVPNLPSREGSRKEWGCIGAGEATPGDLNHVPHTGAPDLLSETKTRGRTKGPGDICDPAAPSPY